LASCTDQLIGRRLPSRPLAGYAAGGDTFSGALGATTASASDAGTGSTGGTSSSATGSGTFTGSSSIAGMTGLSGMPGACTVTWRISSSRENSMGRKITANATSTSAPTIRCLSPLSSTAIACLRLLAEPRQGLGHAIERSEHEDFIILPRHGTLYQQCLSNAGTGTYRLAQIAQRRFKLGHRAAARAV